ncbi:MAG: mannose-1-phosphate guanylyltransferase/mannose-6-phosphate isomerase [Pseudomonadota bacterium]
METSPKIVPVVLAGGKGTRLWPMSRSSRPKQFLNLIGEGSLFQQTLVRVSDSSIFASPIIVTNEEYRFLVAEQAAEIGITPLNILLEPVARNTAPAIAAASISAIGLGSETLVFVLPCDHKIVVDEAYEIAITHAKTAAAAGNLVTFGVTPTSPAIGFGYVKANGEVTEGVHRVDEFVEKPKLDLAKKMYKSGDYYWNSGMFMFDAGVFLDEAKKLSPEVYSAAGSALDNANEDLDFTRLDAEAFAASPSISVDHAIFEHTSLAAVVEFPVDWSDLGSWGAVWEAGKKDANGNVCSDTARTYASKNSLVLSDGINLVVDGLSDVAVIANENITYIGRLSNAQNIGKIVKDLQSDPDTADLTETHKTVHRPWGGYTSILSGERYQVKRLFVKPGERLSLQKHHHRSEHWVVIRGTAEIQIGEDVQIRGENESVYIPMNTVHRLSNPGKILLEVIEVQTGTYLGEDDIIRIDDTFGRC